MPREGRYTAARELVPLTSCWTGDWVTESGVVKLVEMVIAASIRAS